MTEESNLCSKDIVSSMNHDHLIDQEKTSASKLKFRADEFSARIKQYKKDEFETPDSEDNVIGFGDYSRVCKYCHKNKLVAIKEFKIAGNDEKINNIWDTLLLEANILCRLHHENIVEILGVTLWTNGVGIIMEYVDGGNLRKLLSQNNRTELSWNIRLQIAQGIASGLDYLHSYGEKKMLCHGDLKPENVLLTNKQQVKLAGFGSAAFYRATGASTTTINQVSTTQFTVVYAAPEFLQDYTQKKSPAMDMYSYAMILYELISGKLPYSDCSLPASVPALILAKIKPSMKLINSVESQLKSDDNQKVFNCLKELMERCWNSDPALRPASRRAKMEVSRSLMKQQQGSRSPNPGDEAFIAEVAADEKSDKAGILVPKKSFEEEKYEERSLEIISNRLDFFFPPTIEKEGCEVTRSEIVYSLLEFAKRVLGMDNINILMPSAPESFYDDDKPLASLGISEKQALYINDLFKANLETNFDKLRINKEQPDRYKSQMDMILKIYGLFSFVYAKAV